MKHTHSHTHTHTHTHHTQNKLQDVVTFVNRKDIVPRLLGAKMVYIYIAIYIYDIYI